MKTVSNGVVPCFYNKKPLYDFLKKEMKLSNSLIKKAKQIENGILVNQKLCFVNHIVCVGDKVQVTIQTADEKSENIPLSEEPLDVVYEDSHILIVNKPGGIPTHPSLNNYSKTLGGMVMNYYQKKSENFVFRPVTRLDKGTSGLCVIAKNPHIHELLKEKMHSDDFVREYLAVVQGSLTGEGVIEAPIYRENNSIIKRCVDQRGDYAKTYYKTIKKSLNRTLVQLRLYTGRTHQIRVHLSYISHPLTGDFLYGKEEKEISRPALHSYKLYISHPITNEEIKLVCPLPNEISALISD